jgi:hypothetical protein
MSNASRPFPRGELRVSDADRDLAIAELSEHFQTGRLTQEEFDDRSARALQARTGRELTELFADLPGTGSAGPAWSGPSWTGASPTGASSRVSGRFDRSPRRSRPVGLVVVVIAAIAIASLLGAVAHFTFGWLIPLLIVALIIRRAARRR